MLRILKFGFIAKGLGITNGIRNRELVASLHQLLALLTISNQVRNGDDFQVVFTGESHEFGHSLHRTIVVDQLRQ